MFNIPLNTNLDHPIPTDIADGVKIVVLPDMPSHGGNRCRGMVATQDFQPGDVVVKEPPYAHAVSEAEAEDICCGSMCPVVAEQGSLCGGCRLVRYCSRAAQKRDWAAGHKFECKALQASLPHSGRRAQSLPATMVRLAARCLWRRLQEASSPLETGAGFWGSFSSISALLDHLNDGPASQKYSFAAISSRMKHFAHCSGPRGTLDDVNNSEGMQLVAKLAANCLNISLDDGTSVGLGIYPICAMANHANMPNVAQIFRSGVLNLRAVRPIQAGEEVCITYCGLEQPSFQSRQELQQSFFFDSCPHLPSTENMHAARTHRLDTTMYAHIVGPDVSSKLAANERDAALCAVARTSERAQERFCWASVVNTDPVETSGDILTGGAGRPQAGTEPQITEQTVEAICKQGWQPSHALGSRDPQATTPLWHEQVIEEGWAVHVRLFGDWETCMHGDEDTSWLEVASAAAFGQVGVMWARELLHTGRRTLGRLLLERVEAAGVSGGLSDTHEVMIEARSELMKFAVNESNKLGAVNASKAKVLMRQALEYGLKAIKGKEKIYPPAWYDLAATWRSLGDGAVAKACPAEALEYWHKAYESLSVLLGQVPEVDRLRGRLRYHSADKSNASELAEALELMKRV